MAGNEAHQMRQKIDRCRRSLLVVHDVQSVRRLSEMIAEAEQRISELEASPTL